MADLTFDDQLTLIDRAIEAGDDVWELLSDAAAVEEGEIDVRRWNQCDIAARVVKRYGRDAVGEWAKRANIPKARAREYRTMGMFYSERSARAEFLADHPNVTYSHLRAVARKAETAADAYSLLETVSAEGWTVDETAKRVGGSKWERIAVVEVPAGTLAGVEQLAEQLASIDETAIVRVAVSVSKA